MSIYLRRISPIAQASCFSLFLLLFPYHAASASTLVRVTTSLGDFDIELFDDITPLTVANFLNYVNSGRYDGTIIHRLVANFVIQGGWLTFDEATQNLQPITTDSAIVNEFAVSNTRGTIAMAKVEGDPNSATSQWFINLVDNNFLDSSNGGFTVFGQVVGDGMGVVDQIAGLEAVTLVSGMEPFPVINYGGGAVQNANLVNISMSVVEEVVPQPNYYDDETERLYLTVNAGAAGIARAEFSVVSTTPSVQIQLILDSVEVLSESVDKISTFDDSTGLLVIPELAVVGVVAYQDLSFQLIDSALFVFELQ
jgi:peptidyl-prolyl cis-trans isomerase A (cyclophilin A)